MKPVQTPAYSIFFENSLQQLKVFLAENHYSKIFFLVDSNTEKYCLPLLKERLPDLLDFDIIELDPGEENKNIDFCIGIWKMLLDFNADRNSLLINLGGGVVTDMGGFAASTFKRGIDFVNIPTTLLSQVDASVGGKTGIDMDGIKNIIGTFAQPKAIFIEPEFLKTLDKRQLRSGFAEIIKHGLIYNADLFEDLRNSEPENISPEIIHRSVDIKNIIVSQDPFEKGLRKILNYGHTIGHALESLSLQHDQTPLLHGEAIAIGFICEAFLSNKINGLSGAELKTISETILRIFPKYPVEKTAYPELIKLMMHDKKNSQEQISFSLLNKIGKCTVDTFCSDEDIYESLDYYRHL